MATLLRVSGAFVTQFDEALERLNAKSNRVEYVCNLCDNDQGTELGSDCKDKECEGQYGEHIIRGSVPRKLAIEEFLDEILPLL